MKPSAYIRSTAGSSRESRIAQAFRSWPVWYIIRVARRRERERKA